MLDDGSIGIFSGDYQLTKQDLDNLDAHMKYCRAEYQRKADEEVARLALQSANQPSTPSQFVIGPGARPVADVSAANARNYASLITDPNLKSQVTRVVERTLTNKNQASTGSGQVTIDKPIDAVPIEAGFPSVTGGSETASGASETPLSKYLLAGLALLAFMR